MKPIYLFYTTLFVGCAIVNDITLPQKPYQLPEGTVDTARIRVNTDALAFIYPRGCADAGAPGAGVAVFQNNSDRRGTTKGNNRVLGMPAGSPEFSDPRFGSSELTIPAQKFITLEYRYDNKTTASITTCSGAYAFMPITGHDYEAVLFTDNNKSRCVVGVRDMTVNQQVNMVKVTGKNCPVPNSTAATTDIVLTKKDSVLTIGLANDQGRFVQASDKFPRDTYVFAHTRMEWNNISDTDTPIKGNTSKTIRTKWFDHQGTLVKEFTQTIRLAHPPAWVNNWVKSSRLGIGSGKVEVYDGDKLLAKSKFEVLDMSLDEFKLKYPAPTKP